MPFIAELREVSESVLSQLTERFRDLPRPLLAAIGAGDFAVERLAELRETLSASLEKSTPNPGDVREFAADLPAKVQEAASEMVESMQKFAVDAPAKTQHLVAQLPDRVNDIREALSAEQLRGALDAYTQLAGVIYGSLADRGDKKWTDVLTTAGHDPTIVNPTSKFAAKPTAGPAAKVTAAADVVAGTAATAASVPGDSESPVVKPTASAPVVGRPSTAKPAGTKLAGVAAHKPATTPVNAKAAAKAAAAAAAFEKPATPSAAKPAGTKVAGTNRRAPTTPRRPAAKPVPKPAAGTGETSS